MQYSTLIFIYLFHATFFCKYKNQIKSDAWFSLENLKKSN